MTSIIVVLPKLEDAKGIKNVLVRSGFSVSAVCTAGAQAVSQTDELNDGIIICSYKMTDMMYEELAAYLPEGFEMLLLASKNVLAEKSDSSIMSLSMPLKVHELIDTVDLMVQNMERKRRKRHQIPKERKPEERAVIENAKNLLMERNHMSEEEAHRYIQKCSMDNGTNMVETAQMVLSVMSA